MKIKRLTNANYAKTDVLFRFKCQIAGVEPTKRQASKYRRGTGRAANVSISQMNQHLIELRWKEEVE